MCSDAFTIYTFLKEKNLLEDAPEFWWPNAGSFEVVIGAILTQNTRWENVEKSLYNLKNHLTLETFITLSEEQLKEKIQPSGFYNQKASRLLALTCNIKKEFKTFENFQKNVTREWLLAQKGIGQESADAILCYGCWRAEMVVDTYTKRLLKRFGCEFPKYEEYKLFLEEGMKYHYEYEALQRVYAEFHAMIVEFESLKKTKKSLFKER